MLSFRSYFPKIPLSESDNEHNPLPQVQGRYRCLEIRDAKNDLFTGNEIHYKKLSGLQPGKTGYLIHSSGANGINDTYDSSGKQKSSVFNDDILRRIVKPILKIDN